ncbi:CoA transferase, partial [Streptomyces goshikiensis]|uniref:CoA transferase n=1 Tax=Streptomyces goshikiensis TaxID=1942 RepID=UPI0036BE5E5E
PRLDRCGVVGWVWSLPEFVHQRVVPLWVPGEAHAHLLDEAVGDWIARHKAEEVVALFEDAEAAVALVYDVRDVMADPQFAALDTVTEVEDPELGPIRMQNVLFRLSETPGAIRWAGRPHGADTDAVLTELGLTRAEIDALRTEGAL